MKSSLLRRLPLVVSKRLARNLQPHIDPLLMASSFVPAFEAFRSGRHIAVPSHRNLSSSSTLTGKALEKTTDVAKDVKNGNASGSSSFIVDTCLSEVSRLLKENTVEEAALAFRLHCAYQTTNFAEDIISQSTNAALIAVLNTLHKSPQQSEAFVRALQEHITEDAASKTENVEEKDKFRPRLWRPNNEHYHMVLLDWLEYDPPSAKRVQALVEYMERETDLQVERDTYNLVLKAWAKKKNAERTQAYFDQ